MADSHLQPNMAETKDVEELENLFRGDKSPEVYIPLAEGYLRRGYPDKAIEVCQQGIKISDDAQGRLVLARAYFDKFELKKAAQEAEGVLSQKPDSWEANWIMGEIYAEQDDFNEAVKYLKKAHELNPEHPQAKNLLVGLGALDKDAAPDGVNKPFHIDVEDYFVPLQRDSLLKTARDVLIFLAVIVGVVYLYASNSILQKKIRALILLGRTQQRIDTYSGLRKAGKVYKKVLDLDRHHPFALIHLAEIHHSLWRHHERTKAHKQLFFSYAQQVNNAPQSLLDKLPLYHALKALIVYENGREELSKGNHQKAKEFFRSADRYLRGWVEKLPLDPRIHWVHGMVYEGLRKQRLAVANFKKAAEVGWNTPKFRWRLGYHHWRNRDFSVAHSNYMLAKEMGSQNETLVSSELGGPDPSKRENEYCWIDPPTVVSPTSPKGRQWGVMDLLLNSARAALRGKRIQKCFFHQAIQKQFQANKLYFPAPLGDALSVLDAGVDMTTAYKMVKELKKTAKEVKKNQDFSPYLQAWLLLARAKMHWYQKDLKKASELIEEALKKAPYEAFFYSTKGLILTSQGEWDKGLKQFKISFKKDPYLLQPYFEGATQFLDATDKEGKPSQNENARLLLEEMKKNFPEHSDYYYLAGRLAVNEGKGKEAEKLWRKALDPSRPPYYGYHYEASFEMGKLMLARSREIGRKNERISSSKFPLLIKKFKEYKKKLHKYYDSRYKKDSAKKVKEDLEKFLAKLSSGRPSTKDINYFVNNLREILYEEAGEFFQQAMQTRPGAVDARYWMGIVYFDNERWNDCRGHFEVASSGYVRTLDFEGARKAFDYVMRAIQKSNDKRRKAREEVGKYFKAKAIQMIRLEYLKLKAKKKKKAKKEDLNKVVRVMKIFAELMEKSKYKKEAKLMRKEAEDLAEGGFMSWKERFEGGGQPAKGKKRGRR